MSLGSADGMTLAEVRRYLRGEDLADLAILESDPLLAAELGISERSLRERANSAAFVEWKDAMLS